MAFPTHSIATSGAIDPSILQRFPDKMSKEDFYKIAHVSKRTAEYLLKTGVVPCEYTGKKTRCFIIRTKDVLEYLRQRERDPEAYAVPSKWYRAETRGKTMPATLCDELTRIAEEKGDVFRCFISRQLKGYDDLLTVSDVAEATGYHKSHINNLCRCGSIKAFRIQHKNLIPKVTLIDYLATPERYRRYLDVEDAPKLVSNFLTSYRRAKARKAEKA